MTEPTHDTQAGEIAAADDRHLPPPPPSGMTPMFFDDDGISDWIYRRWTCRR
jgi:hypothetical protein